MDRNFVLALALSMLVVMIYTSTRPPVEEPPLTQPAPNESAVAEEGAPSSGVEIEDSGRALRERTPAASRADVSAYASAPAFEEETKTIEGAQFVAELSNRGGAITSYALRGYQTAPAAGDPELIDLLASSDGELQVGATPFEELGIGNLRWARFEVEDEDSRSITFVLERNGVRVSKHYRFDLDGYTFELAVAVENTSGEVLHPRFEIEWQAAIREGNDYANLSVITRHDGSVDRTPIGGIGSSGFLGFGGDDGLPKTGGVDWFGADTTYFVGALAPQRGGDAQAQYVAFKKGEMAANVLSFEGITLPSGNRITQELRGYIGPKLEDIATP